MKEQLLSRLRSERGITRLHAILLSLTAVLLLAAAVPAWRNYQWRNDVFHCSLSVEKMQDIVDMEVIHRARTLTEEETAALLTDYKERGEILCPSGGEFFAVDTGNLSMKVVCSLHDSDGARAAYLSARRCLARVQTEVLYAQRVGHTYPESVAVTMNGKPLEARSVTEPTGLRRGTSSTKGYKGVVAFYGIEGDPSAQPGFVPGGSVRADGTVRGGPSAEPGTVPESVASSDTAEAVPESGAPDTDGAADASSDTEAVPRYVIPEKPDIWYFAYADENHAAAWTIDDGWYVDGQAVPAGGMPVHAET